MGNNNGTAYTCEDCGWVWPLAGEPPAGSECDNCGGILMKDGTANDPRT